MNVQHWAVFFIAILSCNYASAFFFGHYKGVGRGYDDDDSGYYGWSKGCSCRGRLTTRLDKVLDRIKSKIGRSYVLPSHSMDEYELKDGGCSGLHKFERRGPYRCSVTRDYARIFFRIGFLNLLIHYKLSILSDILSTFMGGFASVLERFFGRITDFFFRVAPIDYYVSVVLRQDFSGDGGLRLEGFYPSNVDKLEFRDGAFGRHAESITPYLRPVIDHGLRYFFHSELRTVFSSFFRRVTVTRDLFSYKYGGRYHSWSSYGGDGDGESGGSSSGEWERSSTSSYTDGGDGDGESGGSSSGEWGGSSSYRSSYTDGGESDSGSYTYTTSYEEDGDDTSSDE